MERAIERLRREHRREVFLVGLAKRSKVLLRYSLALALEGVFPPGAPRYVRVPRSLEVKAYIWPEYARGPEVEGDGREAPKFVSGDMYFVRFGGRSADPLWTVDIFSSLSERADEIFGYLLADAMDGFPIPLYPRCLQRAHSHARIVDFDLEILQDEVVAAVEGLLADEERVAVEAMRLRGALAPRREG